MELQAGRLGAFSGRRLGSGGAGRQGDTPPHFYLLRPALPAGPGPKAATFHISLDCPWCNVMIKTEVRRQTQSTDVLFFFNSHNTVKF